METHTNKLTQLINIRAVAILLVVFGHSIIIYSSGWGVYATTRQAPVLAWLKELINVVQMPLFFSLSGYLFVFTHRKKKGLVKLLQNKALRLLVPYFLVGFLYLVPLKMMIHYPGYEGTGISNILMGFLMGTDVGHLWFLPTLFLIFALAELILLISGKIPGLLRVPAVSLVLSSGLLYLEGYRITLGYGPLQSAYWNLIWFALGYFISTYQNQVQRIYDRSWIKWLLLTVNLLAAVYCSTLDQMGLVLRLALPALYILNAYGAMPEKTCRLPGTISTNSFGIYLFHSPLIYITFAMLPNAAPVLVVLINFVGFGLIAYGLTNLVRRLKLEFVIGE